MVEYVPPTVMELRWGDGETLRLEVRPDGDGSELTLINVFDEVGKAARDAAGWHACLDALVADLDGQDPPRETRWAESIPSTSSASAPRRRPSGHPDGISPDRLDAGRDGGDQQDRRDRVDELLRDRRPVRREPSSAPGIDAAAPDGGDRPVGRRARQVPERARRRRRRTRR